MYILAKYDKYLGWNDDSVKRPAKPLWSPCEAPEKLQSAAPRLHGFVKLARCSVARPDAQTQTQTQTQTQVWVSVVSLGTVVSLEIPGDSLEIPVIPDFSRKKLIFHRKK